MQNFIKPHLLNQNTSSINVDLSDIDPSLFYSENNKHLKTIQGHFPKLKIHPRDTLLNIAGSAEDANALVQKIHAIKWSIQTFNHLSTQGLENILLSTDKKLLSIQNTGSVLLYGVLGKAIKAQSANQQKIVESAQTHDMIFAVGPAGTGKTYTAVALAVKALK